MQEVAIQEAEGQLRQLAEKALNGEEVWISLEDKRRIRLEAAPPPEPLKAGTRQLGHLKGIVFYMAEDFDAPLEEFEEYM